jgi:hypothetical protein
VLSKGAAVGHSAWAKRVAAHPRVLAALAAEQVSELAGRLICLWTGKLPEQYRDDADEVLLGAAAAGLGLEELAALFAQMYERARGDLPDQDPDRDFDDLGPPPRAAQMCGLGRIGQVKSSAPTSMASPAPPASE